MHGLTIYVPDDGPRCASAFFSVSSDSRDQVKARKNGNQFNSAQSRRFKEWANNPAIAPRLRYAVRYS
jgi:hypothetical protein